MQHKIIFVNHFLNHKKLENKNSGNSNILHLLDLIGPLQQIYKIPKGNLKNVDPHYSKEKWFGVSEGSKKEGVNWGFFLSSR